jgi:hypothetical protein
VLARLNQQVNETLGASDTRQALADREWCRGQVQPTQVQPTLCASAFAPTSAGGGMSLPKRESVPSETRKEHLRRVGVEDIDWSKHPRSRPRTCSS